MARHKTSTQLELFIAAVPATTLPAEVMERVVPLLQQLVAEVLGGADGTEGGNEQDHP